MNVQTEAHLASSTVKEESQRNPHETECTYMSVNKNYFALLLQLM